MNELMINGTQSFMEKEIPVVSGGFGVGKRCMSDKTIAEIHGMRGIDVRRRISDNIKRFKENVDFIDLKQRVHETHTSEKQRILSADTSEDQHAYDASTLDLLGNLGYAKQSITQAEHIYLLSERGYAKLIKIMDTDKAWEVHDKLIDEYFELKEESINRQQLSPQMQLMNMLVESMSKNELEQKRQAEKLVQLDNKVASIKEVVALNATQWRKDSANIINKIAKDLGGYEHIKPIRDEIYRLLEQRMGVALNIRLTNKKKTMLMNGVCKSKVDKLNQLDVIADDKKLIEGYIAIVKEMAVKYGTEQKGA